MHLIDRPWPTPNDAAAGAALEATLRDAAGDDDTAAGFVDVLLRDPGGRAMVRGIGGHSRFLAGLMARELATLHHLCTRGPDAAWDRIEADLAALDADTATEALMRGLRRVKRRAALVIGLCDVAGVWDLSRVTGCLSMLADRSLTLAARQALRGPVQRGHLTPPDPERPDAGSGLIVLGMGKLGGGELNYSSDVDLIVFYDDETAPIRDPDDLQKTFVRVTRDLVRIMEERTADGYVFRTDLRLRPDPAATPLAVSLSAAETYYGSMAQTWERSAMIKARPVAGDLAAGARFLEMIEPFVWRRHLDFAAIEDIHIIKRRINEYRGHSAIAVNGHNVKVGRGGIREIEFLAQAHQMIYGGRQPRLRRRQTVATLNDLVTIGHIPAETAADLTEAYAFLRRLEHRLQMVDDRQTHSLPDTDQGIAAIGGFMGIDDPAAFRSTVTARLETVQRHYSQVFEGAGTDDGGAPDPVPALDFSGVDDDPALLSTLADLGFIETDRACRTVRAWLSGRYRAMRSDRARRLLTEILPRLLHALGRTAAPDTALLRFNDFLEKLPAGVQLFSLFHANPNLLDFLAEMMGTSQRLAEHLARKPEDLESLVSPGFFDALPDRASLDRELGDLLATARDFEDVLDVLRVWTNDQRFRAGAHILRGITHGDRIGGFLSDVAEVGLTQLWPRVRDDFAQKHGDFGGPGLAILALGKLGGREMSIRSDLDVIMVYDVNDPQAESNGAKPLPASTYYTRLLQRFLSAITAKTAEGALYEVDMRLRPSGRTGPLATSLESFLKYQSGSAWTWEHMALTRARCVLGPEALAGTLRHEICRILTAPRDARALLLDVDDMRRRIDTQHHTDVPWQVKYVRGGLVDIEFIAQYLQLCHAQGEPDLVDPNTGVALQRLADAGHLDRDVASDLDAALRACQRVQAYLRLTYDGAIDPDTAAAALMLGAARAVVPDADDPNVDQARRYLEDRLARAYAHFQALIEVPAEALRAQGMQRQGGRAAADA